MAGLLDILAGSTEDVRARREIEDFNKNIQRANIERPTGPGIAEQNIAANAGLLFDVRNNAAQLRSGVQQATGRGPFRQKALMKQATDEVKKLGISPVKDRKGYLSALAEATGKYPELQAATLGLSEAVAGIESTEAKAGVEQAKLGIEIDKLNLERRKDRRAILENKLKAAKTVEEIRKARQDLAHEAALHPGNLEAQDALTKQRRASATESSSLFKDIDSLDIPQNEKDKLKLQSVEKRSTEGSGLAFSVASDGTVYFSENGELPRNTGKLSGGKSAEIALRRDKMIEGINMIDSITSTKDSNLGLLGTLKRVVSETRNIAQDLGEDAPIIGGFIEGIVNQMEADSAAGKVDDSVIFNTFPDGFKVTELTIPQLENSLAYVLARAQVGDARLTNQAVQNAKKSVRLTGLQGSKTVRGKLENIRKQFLNAAKRMDKQLTVSGPRPATQKLKELSTPPNRSRGGVDLSELDAANRAQLDDLQNGTAVTLQSGRRIIKRNGVWLPNNSQ